MRQSYATSDGGKMFHNQVSLLLLQKLHTTNHNIACLVWEGRGEGLHNQICDQLAEQVYTRLLHMQFLYMC